MTHLLIVTAEQFDKVSKNPTGAIIVKPYRPIQQGDKVIFESEDDNSNQQIETAITSVSTAPGLMKGYYLLDYEWYNNNEEPAIA